MKRIVVRPVQGLLVRDPETMKPVSEDMVVMDTPYWRRRLRDGDVVLIKNKETGDQEKTGNQEIG